MGYMRGPCRYQAMSKLIIVKSMVNTTGMTNLMIVKCTLVQALRLCTGRTAHRGCSGVNLLLLEHGTKRG